jgi:hypothetical protein
MRRSPSIIPDAAERDVYLDRQLGRSWRETDEEDIGRQVDWIEIAGLAVALLSLIWIVSLLLAVF